ncbi:MAG: hypothetical protein ACOYOO_16005 [Saprospiraceae bacterium]|jgi:hypothetical protein
MWIETILEIIKLTIPALIVFFTVDRLMRQYLGHQLQLQLNEAKKRGQDLTTPLRLQAYERLSLLCERIDLPSLILRVRPENLSANEYRLALLLSIQQEYEHNITQQVYVSAQLWEIIKLARDDNMQVIEHALGQIPAGEDARKLAGTILQVLAQRGESATGKAQLAIKREAASLF